VNIHLEFYLQEMEFGFTHGQLGVIGLRIFSWRILEAISKKSCFVAVLDDAKGNSTI
jgi:hypothetical protein